MTEEPRQPAETEEVEEYEPPRVEDVPAQDGPAVTAAGHSPGDSGSPGGPEWRPEVDDAEGRDDARRLEE